MSHWITWILKNVFGHEGGGIVRGIITRTTKPKPWSFGLWSIGLISVQTHEAKAPCLFLRIPNSPWFSPLSLPLPPPRLPTQAARWGGAAHEFFSHSSARQERSGKTYPLVYLRCLLVTAGGQTRTGQAFANSRQTLTNHVCPWLRPRIKKCVWPEYSRAENGKITGWSQENNPGC